MNSQPNNSLQPSSSLDIDFMDLSDWEQIESLVEGLIEQDRQSKPKSQPPNPETIARAIAKILPAAIASEIKSNPEAIAKAIAPEIAISIREQILLDEEAIPQTLGPEMGKAIKAQIESEKDAMVDALYPVIGSTISKYMVEVVQDINRKIESSLTPEGFNRKLRARMQGISEAELIFKESIGCHVRAIFLIAKDSGLVIQEIQIAGEQRLDAEMLAGMLTAIRSFANDCITAGSELDSIDYGDWQIPLEVAGYCYLAVIVAGEPTKKFTTKIRRVLGEIVLEYDEEIQKFAGDPNSVPFGIREKLEQLTEVEPPERHKSSSPIILWLLVILLGVIFIPLGIGKYHQHIALEIAQQAAIALDAAPELSVYRLDPQVNQGKLTVTGRVPSPYHRDRAQQIMDSLAQEHNLELDNQIIAVDVPIDPTLAAGEIQRLTDLFNQQEGIAIETDYQAPKLQIKGYTQSQSSQSDIVEAFSQIPGVEQVVVEIAQRLPQIEQRLYFASGSSELNAENLTKVAAINDILKQNPQLHLRLIAHSDGVGSPEVNRKLSQERCDNLIAALVARGIESSRLLSKCNLLSFNQNQDRNRAVWSERYISFEPFIPSNSSP